MSLLSKRCSSRVFLLGVILLFPAPYAAWAYVGPGAGFALVSSFFIFFLTFVSVVFILLTWPLRWVFKLFFGKKPPSNARARRVIVLGLDGQDPELTEKWMEEGLLPNFSALQEEGTFTPLGTTLLAESPVAWSSFQTGCNPGKHGIYDFLVPNRKSHLPELSSAQVSPPGRVLNLGPFKIPIGRPRIRVGRKSKPFWITLSEHGVFSSILRVPITFPPEKFRGVLLSAMCIPDLKGSQGSFFYYSTDPEDPDEFSGGYRIPVECENGVARSYVSGPENTLRPETGEVRVPFEVRLNGKDAILCLEGKQYPLKPKTYTPYIRVEFKMAPGIKATGICRFYLLETEPHFKLYMTPLNIDPDKPALPISHPFTYAPYLAKTQGLFSTLGLAEDTNALKAGVIDEEAFLQQAYDIHLERERMFFDALEKTRRGTVVCVFDITDRLQHMFFRYLDEDHPGNRGRDTVKHKNAVKELYVRMDELVGRARKELREGDVLFVMSDHGFKPFKRGVNLNTWLYRNGYLAIKGEKPTGTDYFQDVDWSRTRAYSMGFGGIYLNRYGREARGIVQPEEAASLKKEIRGKLLQLRDESHECSPIREVYDAEEVYSGPYVGQAPDLSVGFLPGYRASVLSVTGGISEELIEDNEKDWSGDHNFNPPDVPGMLFCNRKLEAGDANIIDLAPTILDLFGIDIPRYIDGKSLMPASTKGE